MNEFSGRVCIVSEGHEIQSSISTVSACHRPLSLTKTGEGSFVVVTAAGVAITLLTELDASKDNEWSEQQAHLSWKGTRTGRTGPDRTSQYQEQSATFQAGCHVTDSKRASAMPWSTLAFSVMTLRFDATSIPHIVCLTSP